MQRALRPASRLAARTKLLSQSSVTTGLLQKVPVASLNTFADNTDSEEEGVDAKLRATVGLMGRHLGACMSTRDHTLIETVEKLRLMCREWRNHNQDPKFLAKVSDELEGLDSLRLKGLARAFAHFLGVSNVAENQAKLRRLRKDANGLGVALGSDRESVYGTIKFLRDEKKLSADEIMGLLAHQLTEIVLTAHPTEVNRRTVTTKQQNIHDVLDELDRPDLLRFERREMEKALEREITALWASDTLKRAKPTPVEEAKAGLAIVESVLWKAVPLFLRKVDFITQELLGKPLPLHTQLLKMASWMGGDRDGNPFVTAEITMEVALQTRWLGAELFKKNLIKLKDDLSLSTCSDELSQITGAVREPYRHLLGELIQRLEATQTWAELGMEEVRGGGNSMGFLRKASGMSDKEKPLLKTSELMYPLRLMRNSLVKTGYGPVAEGLLTDTIRALRVFGLALVPLDVRQESGRHMRCLDAITRYLNMGSYASWDEEKKLEWLSQELNSGRPLLAKHRDVTTYGFDPEVEESLKTFAVLAHICDDSLGAYVISHCKRASDVLAVMLLQQDAGIFPRMRVVPLFETLADLERAPLTVKELFTNRAYSSRIDGKQEIMVGYSDSGKDAGRFAANWQLYEAQEKIAQTAREMGVEVTFFHGKGGTVGRGGNPALFKAITAHPPKTIQGRFRVTEQGEMITYNFGHQEIAGRTLDLITAGVLAEGYVDRDPKPEWKDVMYRMAKTSCDAYRKLVREDPRFIPYFRLATPEKELANLNVGSRPAKRNPTGGLESLRAIPWVFAWTQSRLNLPAWLGVGQALSKELQDETSAALLREMYADWPWFRTILDLLEMILVKSDGHIAEYYNHKLVENSELQQLGKELLDMMEMTEKSILSVTGHPSLASPDKLLLRSLEVRNPYVDALNTIQVELLARLRKGKHGAQEETVLRDALLITINGIAAGMRNSG